MRKEDWSLTVSGDSIFQQQLMSQHWVQIQLLLKCMLKGQRDKTEARGWHWFCLQQKLLRWPREILCLYCVSARQRKPTSLPLQEHCKAEGLSSWQEQLVWDKLCSRSPLLLAVVAVHWQPHVCGWVATLSGFKTALTGQMRVEQLPGLLS